MVGGFHVAFRALVVSVLLGLSACNFNPFELGAGGDGGTSDGMPGDDGGNVIADAAVNDGRINDAQPMVDGCTPTPEVCDGMDNDCDTSVDEDFNLNDDPANCGSCGNTCDLSGTAGTCDSGGCQYTCQPGYHDLNNDLNMPGSNGCEYGPCIATGAETCNFTDDDCDGEIDEGLMLDTDPLNCGSCFNECPTINVNNATCSGGVCGYDSCVDGFADVNTGVIGCEYTCPLAVPLAQEECNAIDDDCDGVIDELPITGLGTDCGPTPPGETGECSWGSMQCVFGVPTCQGYQGPVAETCDNLDNDCDGTDDNGFDKDNDPNNCGPSCTTCDLPNAVNGCSSGTCNIIACLPGFVNSDGNVATGCNYACTPTGPEVCDGVDNDCDESTDELLTPPPGVCRNLGPCTGTEATCSDCGGTTAWRCVYTDGDVETDACGDVVIQETACDDADGDCDGLVDESFTTLGANCDDGGLGICRGTGNEICDPADSSQTMCDITTPGQTALADELCNNLDDDCDSTVDESAVDDTVLVTGGALADFRIDMYEASRPDATGSTAGSVESRSCSNPDVLPWRQVTRLEAAAACAAAGKRLCTENEWKLACTGLAGNTYPYGSTYQPEACNGYDYDIDCLPPNQNEHVIATGHDYQCGPPMADSCVSEFGAYDMSGNLKEWTGEDVGGGIHRVLGGAYSSIEQGLTCTFDFLAFDDTVALPTLGFRCCQDSP